MWLALVGAGLVVLGSFLPWAEASAGIVSASVGGMDVGDGQGRTTLAGAILYAALWWFNDLAHRPDRGQMYVAGAVALAGMLFAVVKMDDINSVADEVELAHVSVGVGLWLVLVGSIVGFAACVVKVRR